MRKSDGFETRDWPLQKINLNLIPVLRALLKEESVSGAAAVLGRSPSAVSEALSQLRAALEDPLFVRVGARLRPTPKAAELAGPLEELHERLELFFKKGLFEPSESDRHFVIASSDLLIYRLGLRMIQAIRRAAPQMSIHFVDIGRGLTQAMAAREIDFALLPEFAVADLAPAPLRFQALDKAQDLVALMSADHPLAARTMVRPQDLEPYKRVSFLPNPVLLEGRKEARVDGIGRPGAAVVVGQYLAIPHLLAGTDLVAVVARGVAETAIATLPLALVSLDHPNAHRLGIAWSPVYDHDPAHLWFRGAIADEAVDLRRSDVDESVTGA